MTFDVILRGGLIIDGTGGEGRPGDIGIQGQRIAAIGDLSKAEAADVLDVAGTVVCPGFIDVHTHSDLTLLVDGRAESKVHQGVTTEIIGNCSYSPYPLRPERPEMLRRFDFQSAIRNLECDWTDLEGYARRVEERGVAVNVVPLVGHAAVRIAVMGEEERAPTADELKAMQRLTAEMLEQGAFGLSVGLTLVPSCFAETDELIALAKVVASYDRYYTAHSRVWAGWHRKAIEEDIAVGRASGCRVQVSHLAIIDNRHYGEADQLVQLIEDARKEGVDIFYDVYPYTAAGTLFDQFFPVWVQEGGVERMLARLGDREVRRRLVKELRAGWFGGIPFEWDKIVITEIGSEDGQQYLGWSLQQVADALGMEPEEAAIELVLRERNVVGVVAFNQCEGDLRVFLSHPLGMIGSDGSAIAPREPFTPSKPHPRFYGTYPRVLGRYVRSSGVLSLPEAIHKMTGLPAMRFGLHDRGVLAVGKVADLVVFDPTRVIDQATFENPHQFPVGILHVFVNGVPVLRDGQHTGALPGKVLRAG